MVMVRHRHGGGSLVVPGTRTAALWPFDATSPWNMPRGTAATFYADTHPMTLKWLQNTYTDPWTTNGNVYPMTLDSALQQPISYATGSDPLATITDSSHSLSIQARIPTNVTIASGSDSHMGVVQPDGYTFVEGWACAKQDNTHYTSGRIKVIDLRGSGLGPDAGCRAYGGSMIGGQIRKEEIAAGLIPHAISMVLPWWMLYAKPNTGWGFYYNGEAFNDGVIAPGWPTGLNLFGFDKELGYVYPATEEDWAAVNNYTGLVPMGQLFSIPNTTDVTAQGLAPATVMLAHAIQDYGAYPVDTDGADPGIVIGNVETHASTTTFRNALTAGINGEMDKLRKLMRPVLNNTSVTPGGVPFNNARRASLAPAAFA